MALLEEDLRSPCTEEIAVFSAFARTVAEGEHGFVVLDTAPTGHTILLLDAAEAYHRDVTRTMSDAPDEVRQLLPRLRDAEFTRVLLVTCQKRHPSTKRRGCRKTSNGLASSLTPGSSIRASPARDSVIRFWWREVLAREPYVAEVRDRLATPIRGDSLDSGGSRRSGSATRAGSEFNGACGNGGGLKDGSQQVRGYRFSTGI